MKREDIEKLIGGYATGSLTEQERRALFEAALSDQALFEALAGEEAFREVLLDPRCRRQIDQALRPAPGFLERVAGWARRPHAWALAGSLAATAAIALLVIRTEQAPQPEIQLARQNKVQAPAPAADAPPPAVMPPRRAGSTPAPPAQQKPAPGKKEASPASGGVAGGVVGGIIPAQPAPSAPAEQAPELAESRAVAPPPPPAMAAEAPPAAPPEKSKDVSTVAAGPGPVQFQANRPEPAHVRTLGTAAVRQDAAASPQVRYVVEVKDAAGQFVEATPGTSVAPGVPVRLILMPDEPGTLSVLDNSNKLLFSSPAVAGARYTVTPPPSERKFTVILGPPLINTALRASAAKGQLPAGRTVTIIDLTRPRN
jgi:hypothetical protein